MSMMLSSVHAWKVKLRTSWVLLISSWGPARRTPRGVPCSAAKRCGGLWSFQVRRGLILRPGKGLEIIDIIKTVYCGSIAENTSRVCASFEGCTGVDLPRVCLLRVRLLRAATVTPALGRAENVRRHQASAHYYGVLVRCSANHHQQGHVGQLCRRAHNRYLVA